MKTQIIIVAAPSGAGKSSFVEKVIQEVPVLVDVITYTTRSMRRGESEGMPYHFVSNDDFLRKVERGFFVEWAKVHDNLYGTPYDQIENAKAEGKSVIMDIDVQGAATFREKFPDSKHIFILPPSIEELRRRVTRREGGVPPRDLDLRMKNAEIEMGAAALFDYQIINDDFQDSYGKFKKIIEDLLA